MTITIISIATISLLILHFVKNFDKNNITIILLEFFFIVFLIAVLLIYCFGG